MNITRSQVCLLAAIAARSNYGHGLPSEDVLVRLRKSTNLTVGEAVTNVCSNIIETDDHYDMFMEEATSWKMRIDRDGIEDFQKHWPDLWAAMTGG